MWLSQAKERRGPAGADEGIVTLSGKELGVYLDGERRRVTLCQPGGYAWRPPVGARVLVIKAGQAGEDPCVAGVVGQPAEDLAPGEVKIAVPEGGGIYLRQDGTVELSGRVVFRGDVEMEGTLYYKGTSLEKLLEAASASHGSGGL